MNKFLNFFRPTKLTWIIFAIIVVLVIILQFVPLIVPENFLDSAVYIKSVIPFLVPLIITVYLYDVLGWPAYLVKPGSEEDPTVLGIIIFLIISAIIYYFYAVIIAKIIKKIRNKNSTI